MKFDAVIFDMDGVIVDSEPRHERAFLEVFEEMGYGGRHGMDFPSYFGRSDSALWADFIALHNPAYTLEHLTAWKQNRLIEIIRREQPLFPGIPKLVEQLSQRYKLSVASGSLHAVIDVILELENLRRFFPTVVSTQDVGKGKPAPDVFLRAAEKMGVTPDRCCVIEDSAAGVQAGVSAGMFVIAITNSLPRERLAAANRVVGTYSEIEALLLDDKSR